ncbi:MAG: hypothetical protein ABFS32_07795 [Bacteroidota bacterium]
MYLRLLFITLCLIPFTAFSQSDFLNYEEVTFTSELEKNMVESLLNDENEIIYGFLIISPEDSNSFDKWKGYYAKEIDVLKSRKIAKKTSKDVKFIYDKLHEKFLRKYVDLSFFDQIFKTGTYNCVTAVALYAMSFQELGIPYAIKETPNHVYIIADPEESQIYIETTNPTIGIKSFPPGFREEFVTKLGMMKLVDQNDIATKGIYGVFEEHYYGGATISLKQLIGIQFYNLGLSEYEKKNYHEAWNKLTVAQLFHKNDQLSTAMYATILHILFNSNYSDWRDIELLPYLERFKNFDIKDASIVGEFQRMLSYVLISNNDDETAEKAFNNYIEKSINEDIKWEITYSYFYEKAVIAYNRANYDEAFNMIVNSYKAKPGNPDAENLLRESFKLAYRNKSTGQAMARLNTLFVNNPDLKNNNHLNSMHLNLCLTEMGEYFGEGKVTKATKMMEYVEKTIAEHPEYLFNENIMGDAYSKAAVYYYKRGYTTKARQLIKKGLEYDPDNYQLKTRLRMINR